VCEVGDDGALLVRPDQHVAWRAGGSDMTSALGHALGVIAGRVAPDAMEERTNAVQS